MGTQHQSSFQEPGQEQFISYRASQSNSYSPVDFSGETAIVQGPFQKIEMLSTGEPVLEEMALPWELTLWHTGHDRAVRFISDTTSSSTI